MTIRMSLCLIALMLLWTPSNVEGRGYNNQAIMQQQQRAAQQMQNQQNRQNQQKQQQNQQDPVSVDGTIDKISTGGHIVVSQTINEPANTANTAANTPAKPASKKLWTITTQTKTTITTTGTAKADFLHTRLVVQFKAQCDGKTIKDKVGELTITKVTKEKPLGIQPEGSTGSKTQHQFKVGTPENCEIIGRITSAEGSTIKVQAGGKSLTVQLAAEPNISVQMADSSLASPGDRISVRGKRAKSQSQTTTFVADDITITLAEPLTAKKKPVSASSEPAKSSQSVASGSK